MKKVFKLTHPKIKVARLIEGVKHDLKRYIKRERSKKLPEGVDFIDFKCKMGATPERASEIHVSELGKGLDRAEEQAYESVYVEIIPKPVKRTKKAAKRSDRPAIQLTGSVLIGCMAKKNAAINGTMEDLSPWSSAALRATKKRIKLLSKWRIMFARCMKLSSSPHTYLSTQNVTHKTGR